MTPTTIYISSRQERIISTMIVLALVAKGSHILAETHDPAHDRFLPAAQTILSRIPPNASKLSYAFEDCLFHYVAQDGLVYMAVADTDTGRRVPFSFLAHVQKKVGCPISHLDPPALC